MPNAISRIQHIPSSQLDKDNNLRIFLVAMLAVISYSPEYNDPDYDQFIKELGDLIGEMPELQRELEENFFSDIYVDRIERREIENMLSLKKFIIVHGLVGSGKSTIFRKIKAEMDQKGQFQFIYFDLAKIAQHINAIDEIELIQNLEKHVFDYIYKKYIQATNLSKPWDIYVIRNDSHYRQILLKVNAVMNRTIESEEDWIEAYNNLKIRQMFINIHEEPDLLTLLTFLKLHYSYAICLDNIDRYSVDPQKKIMTFATDINKNLEIPVLLAIRETNLRRLRMETVEQRKGGDHLADIQIIEYLDKIEAGDEKEYPVNFMPRNSIKALLTQRLHFFQSRKNLKVIDDFLSEFLRTYSSEYSEIPSSRNEYELKFWDIFDNVSDTFVDEDVYKLCNHSIREMLKTYFLLINSLLLSTEKEYNLKKIFTDETSGRITKLRNYFYKFLITKGNFLPEPSCSLPPIFTPVQNPLTMLDYDILQYIYNFEKRFPDKRLRFEHIDTEFKRFGVDHELLVNRVEYLSKPHGVQDMGLIAIDGTTLFVEYSSMPIEILPSGKYFLEKLSVSREFVFWNALCTDLHPEITDEYINYSDTHSDSFKYKIILKFLDDYLIPRTVAELNLFSEMPIAPKHWNGSHIDYFRSMFGHSGKFFITRVLESVIATINHTELNYYHQVLYRSKFNSLYSKFNEIMEDYVPNYGSLI
jgi:hypothetical protein